MDKIQAIISKLESTHKLSLEEYEALINAYTPELADILAEKAIIARSKIYGNNIYIRGLIEISNICKNNCLYCGIRCENKNIERYRLNESEILACCDEGYELGFRTFVLQGGENPYFSDDVLCNIIRKIKQKYSDYAVTISLGERTYESYKKIYDAGADRYLLRHETADSEHYSKLHPENMAFEHRMECLSNLKAIGFQTGCGFMVGSPYQTAKNLAKDLKFIENFKPEMCGIGPFIPHKESPFKDFKAGSFELTLYLLSIIRLIQPNILLPATTALGSINNKGKELGILAGANVIMPNLSPKNQRKKYELYNNKIYSGEESAENLSALKNTMKQINFEIVVDRGDIKERR
ncbi:MAG: [FeFe] hydrogenase H-cluster radical SAM maturase HydE [Christensenellaceae bacterium]|nr:[FeFe] hydrogenase H-cluster radical SAM maturase HydE [Christensenellaceae bacterium]